MGLENLGGVWVGDRTLKDPNWKWEPTPANVKHLPNMTEIQALPAAVRLGVGRSLGREVDGMHRGWRHQQKV